MGDGIFMLRGRAVTVAGKLSNSIGSEMFGDVSILQRKWEAALRPAQPLPPYEEVMLGSLGRLADNVVLLQGDDDATLEILRGGRFVQQWLGNATIDISTGESLSDCATALRQAASCALQTGRPHRAVAHCVLDGHVQAYDILALPTASRWGGKLIGVYVKANGPRYNLLDAIFSATEEGVLSLATICDADNEIFDFQIVHLNHGASQLLRLTPTELQWRRLSAGGHVLCRQEVTERLNMIVRSGIGQSFEIDSDSRNLRISATVFAGLVSLSMSDVTSIRRREESFRLLFDSNPMPMWVFDAETKEFVGVNDAAVLHYGYDRATFLRLKLHEVWPKDEWEIHSQALMQLGESYHSNRDWRHLKANGEEIQVLTFGRRVEFDGRDGFLVAIVDITERRRAEARVAHMAHHDGLTGLPNRVLYHERLSLALSASHSAAARVAVLCIDLDLFKNVNDSFGHPMGDRLLRMVADRLRSEIHGNHLAARLGGDEFAVVLAADTSPNEANDYAAHLIEVLSAPYDMDGIDIVIGASIGIAMSPGDGEHSDDLMRNADMALYRAKSEGGGVHRFFEREMDLQAQKRRDMELDLRSAFANGELELHFQPLVDLATDRISAFEALLRWRHPDKGMISPADFIPVAEDIGLIVPIGEWVLRRACAEAAKWPPEIKVAVNLSPVQFRNRDLAQIVFSALAYSGLSPLRLELEITESLFLAETEANLAILHQLRAFGVRISMDDFGTGYSSLSYLRSFPFDKIKIDRSFVRDLSQRPDSVAIVRAISGLGRSLNITTTAEGVETADQLDRLRAEGCNEVQGFLFSQARPASEIAQLLVDFGQRGAAAA